MIGTIAPMLIGNVIVYSVGLLLAYGTHDRHPDYTAKDKALRKSTKIIDELRIKRAKALATLSEGKGYQLKSLTNTHDNAKGPRYGELREAADGIVNKDQEVVGALLRYRNALFTELGSRGQRPTFHYPKGGFETLLPITIDRVLTVEEYAAMPLSLGFGEV